MIINIKQIKISVIKNLLSHDYIGLIDRLLKTGQPVQLIKASLQNKLGSYIRISLTGFINYRNKLVKPVPNIKTR